MESAVDTKLGYSAPHNRCLSFAWFIKLAQQTSDFVGFCCETWLRNNNVNIILLPVRPLTNTCESTMYVANFFVVPTFMVGVNYTFALKYGYLFSNAFYVGSGSSYTSLFMLQRADSKF